MGDQGDPDVIEVAQLFETVARILLDSHDMQTTLDGIVALAVEHLENCEYAGISFVEDANITSPASSNDAPRVVDRLQAELQEGPCFDAIKEHEIFLTGDLAGEARWPRFSTRAHEETGVSSVLAIRLFARGNTMGALNLYSSRRDAFDDTDVALGSVFATHAAVAMDSAQREGHLERKAESRDVIGRAKGILMARRNLSDEEAFDVLRRASQRLNVKLVDVAEEINETGKPPISTTPRS